MQACAWPNLMALAHFRIFFLVAAFSALRAPAQTFSLNDVITLKCQANNAYTTVQTASDLNLAANRATAGVLQQFIVRDGGSGRTYTSYGLTGVPETYFIDKRGRVIVHSIGRLSKADLTANVKELLKASK